MIVSQYRGGKIVDKDQYDISFLKELQKIQFLVEATDFEKFCCWEKYHEILTWENKSHGYLPRIGEFHEEPIHISLNFATINDKVVGFFHATSRTVHYGLIDVWIKIHLPQIKRPDNYSDANNFANIVHELETE